MKGPTGRGLPRMLGQSLNRDPRASDLPHGASSEGPPVPHPPSPRCPVSQPASLSSCTGASAWPAPSDSESNLLDRESQGPLGSALTAKSSARNSGCWADPKTALSPCRWLPCSLPAGRPPARLEWGHQRSCGGQAAPPPTPRDLGSWSTAPGFGHRVG